MSKNIIGIIIACCCLLLNVEMVVSQETREIKRTLPLENDGKVSIDTYKGSITVRTWDKPQVDIVATIEPDGRDREQREYVRDTEIRINESPQHIRITSDYDRLRSHRRSFFGLFEGESMTLPFVHYVITMPGRARLTIKDYKSETTITDVHSSITMNTYKGKVTIIRLDGSFELETYKGDVNIDVLKLTADSRIGTRKGSVKMKMPQHAAFTLVTDLGRKANIDSDFEVAVKSNHRGEERNRSEVNGGGVRLKIASEKGEINLRKK